MACPTINVPGISWSGTRRQQRGGGRERPDAQGVEEVGDEADRQLERPRAQRLVLAAALDQGGEGGDEDPGGDERQLQARKQGAQGRCRHRRHPNRNPPIRGKVPA
jgi:hypothetical protein